MNNYALKIIPCVTSLVWLALLAGYTSNASATEDEQKGVANGAAVVALGAAVTSLVFDVDTDGSTADSEADPAAIIDQLGKSLGDKALKSMEALAACKHDRAFVYARQASASSNPDYALAGLWLESLTEADRKNWFEAKAYFPQIRNRDKDIDSEADFDTALSKASKKVSSATSCGR